MTNTPTTNGAPVAEAEKAAVAPAGRRGKKAAGDELRARMIGLGATTTPADTSPPATTTTRRTRKAPTPPETAPAALAPTKRREARATPAAAPADRTPPAAARARSGPGSRGGPMPGEQPTPMAYPIRLSLTTTAEQNRALDMARVEDGVDKTARIRAMIALWQQDEKIRRRVDKAARSWR